MQDACLAQPTRYSQYRMARQGSQAAHPCVLTPRRAALVSGPSLARWAEGLGLGAFLRLGRGEQQTGGGSKESVLATAFEALLGGVYLEAGLAGARRVVASVALW